MILEILGSKRIGVKTWPLGVTWRHRLRDHSNRHRPFSFGGPLDPRRYL